MKTRSRITPQMRAKAEEMIRRGKAGGEIARTLGISLPSVMNIKSQLVTGRSSPPATSTPESELSDQLDLIRGCCLKAKRLLVKGRPHEFEVQTIYDLVEEMKMMSPPVSVFAGASREGI